MALLYYTQITVSSATNPAKTGELQHSEMKILVSDWLETLHWCRLGRS